MQFSVLRGFEKLQFGILLLWYFSFSYASHILLNKEVQVEVYDKKIFVT